MDTSTTNQPHVFISFASEDRNRFVEGFATRLREAGLNAWTSFWEIDLGDSLVRKIFDEGLGGADVVILILSKKSVEKPWVREELDTAVVQRIEGRVRLIPVRIDDCDVPMPLRSIARVSIKDLNDYQSELSEIVRSIYGHRDRPRLGTTPSYVATVVNLFSGLDRVESLVHHLACDRAIQNGHFVVDTAEIEAAAKEIDIGETELQSAIEMLDDQRYVAARRTLSPKVLSFEITGWGFEEYAKSYVPDYDEISRNVTAEVASFDPRAMTAVQNSTGVPQLIITHILQSLDSQGLLKLTRLWGAPPLVHNVSPRLKRLLS